jgi:serine/threonine protein kinase
VTAGFELIRRLGAGYFGEVWLATDTGLDVQRAVKFIPESRVLDPDNFYLEAQILQAVEHTNVVRVYDTGNTDDGRVYVSMEYLSKGSLEDETKGAFVHLSRAKRVMIDVLRGLEHAHASGLIHRDIKPANILVGRNGEGKLSDFGLAIPADTDFKTTKLRDYAYVLHMAPEVHQNRDYSILSDIYAAGVTLYRLVNGDSYLPPLGVNDVEAMSIQGAFPDRSHYREFATRPIKTIINRAMHVDPTRRFPSAQSMRRSLESVVVEMNWNERRTSRGFEWTCTWAEMCYEVTRRKRGDAMWDVEVRRGMSRAKLRRMTAHCRYGRSNSEALRHTRRVLQGFVLGSIG